MMNMTQWLFNCFGLHYIYELYFIDDHHAICAHIPVRLSINYALIVFFIVPMQLRFSGIEGFCFMIYYVRLGQYPFIIYCISKHVIG